MRRLIRAALLILPAAILGTALAAAAAPSLKAPVVTVAGDTVRLGDIFAELPATAPADAEVARAPVAGRRLALDAGQLLAIAQNYRVDWQPGGRFDRIVVERAAHIVD